MGWEEAHLGTEGWKNGGNAREVWSFVVKIENVDDFLMELDDRDFRDFRCESSAVCALVDFRIQGVLFDRKKERFWPMYWNFERKIFTFKMAQVF